MFKRITAIIFILMANISLLTIAVIPHHHHHNHVCFQNSHYQIEDEGHDHSNTCNGSENNGKNIPDPCVSKIAVLLPSEIVMIRTTGITKAYGELKVLKGIGIQIEDKEVVSIVGASGAGKTTLLQIIGTLDRPDSGAIFYNGSDISRLKGKALAAFREFMAKVGREWW